MLVVGSDFYYFDIFKFLDKFLWKFVSVDMRF